MAVTCMSPQAQCICVHIQAQLEARERLEMDDDMKRAASAVTRVSSVLTMRFTTDVEDRTQADDAIAEAGRVEI